MNLLKFYRSTIGKKLIVALTGLFMVFFVFGHMAGNLKAFGGTDGAGIYKIDHYAEFLRVFMADLFGHAGFLWIFRILLIVSVVLHIVTVIQLKRISNKARNVKYEVNPSTPSRLVIDTMFYGGLILAFFIVFHLAHLTFGSIHPNFEHGAVYSNLYIAFQNPIMVMFYCAVMLFLGLHLYHGTWSVFQTLGINQPKYNPYIKIGATVLAIIVSLGFMTVPLAFMTGILGAP